MLGFIKRFIVSVVAEDIKRGGKMRSSIESVLHSQELTYEISTSQRFDALLGVTHPARCFASGHLKPEDKPA